MSDEKTRICEQISQFQIGDTVVLNRAAAGRPPGATVKIVEPATFWDWVVEDEAGIRFMLDEDELSSVTEGDHSNDQ